MSEKPPSISPPLKSPRPGDPITAAQIAELTTRLMKLERQTWGKQPASWVPPRIAKITGTGASAGYYEGKEVYWDGSAWQEQTGGVTYDSSNAGELYEQAGTEGIANDTIVQVSGIEQQDSGIVRWIFAYESFALSPDVITAPTDLYVKDTDDNEGWLPADQNTLQRINNAAISTPTHVFGKKGNEDEGWNATQAAILGPSLNDLTDVHIT